MNKFSFSSSPAWSIAKRYRNENIGREGFVPGPGAYNLHRSGSRVTPSWKLLIRQSRIGTGIRDGRKDKTMPGPGTYNILKMSDAPRLTFGSRTAPKTEEAQRIPGPGSYNPNGTAVFRNAPGCSLGSRYINSQKQLTPGPGTYNSASTANLTQHPAVKIGTSKRDIFDKDMNPGPGAYASGRPFSAGPKYGFSRFERKIVDEVTPGPGQYEVKHFLEGANNGKGVTLSSKYEGNTLLNTETPGPGQYNLADGSNSRPKTPGVRIGTANRYGKYDNSTPGPGQYNGNYRYRNGPAIKIGSSQRGLHRGDISTPGPGSYEVSANRQRHGITISGHRFFKASDQVPGPGTYNPNNNFVRDRPATAKIGQSRRASDGTEPNPGPGHYTYVDEIKGPKFAFTRQLRGEKSRNFNPGPADYQIPASIPNIPNYILNSTSGSGLRH